MTFVANATLIHKSGDKYGDLTLTGKSYVETTQNKFKRKVECICVCGNIFFTLLCGLRRKKGRTISCGCKKKERMSMLFKTHGMSGSQNSNHIYISWKSMNSRCYNHNHKGYKNWGGRFIKVCDEWRDNFQSFYDWSILNGWELGLSIERKDNNGDYEPDNCRWATASDQSRNKRNNRLVTLFGETKCIADWVLDNRCAVNYHTLLYRIRIGWDFKKAILMPSQMKKWQD